jgi:hypothetical protein
LFLNRCSARVEPGIVGTATAPNEMPKKLRGIGLGVALKIRPSSVLH